MDSLDATKVWSRLTVSVAAVIVLTALYVHLYLANVRTTVQADLQLADQGFALGTTSAQATTTQHLSQQLQTIADTFVNQQFAPTSVVIKDLTTGTAAAVEASTTFPSGELAQLFIAYDIMMQIENGQLNEQQSAGSFGADMTIGDCLEQMLLASEGSCQSALSTLAGQSYDLLTAGDVAVLLEKLHNSKELAANTRQRLANYLKNSSSSNQIATGLPVGSESLHRTAYDHGMLHQATVVYQPQKEYIVVILGGPWQIDPQAIISRYGDLHRQVYQNLVGDL